MSLELFLFIVSLEKISTFFVGKIFFTSSEILSTPGPLKIKSQFPSFEQFLFNKVLKCLSKDLNKPYYAVMAKRLIKKNNDLDYSNPIDSEPMIVFTKKSKMFFNESIAFGANDKNELCWDLGFSKKEMSQGKYPSQTTGDLCRVLGDVFHISCSDQSIETNLLHRINLRKESKINTIEIIKKLCH